MLIVGDGLFAAKHLHFWARKPGQLSATRYPIACFLSTDPVAIDCVMHDFVAAEMTDLTPHANDYLRARRRGGAGGFRARRPLGRRVQPNRLPQDRAVDRQTQYT